MKYEELRQECLAYAGFSPNAEVNILEILEQMRENSFNVLSPRICFRLAGYIEELRNNKAELSDLGVEEK